MNVTYNFSFLVVFPEVLFIYFFRVQLIWYFIHVERYTSYISYITYVFNSTWKKYVLIKTLTILRMFSSFSWKMYINFHECNLCTSSIHVLMIPSDLSESLEYRFRDFLSSFFQRKRNYCATDTFPGNTWFSRDAYFIARLYNKKLFFIKFESIKASALVREGTNRKAPEGSLYPLLFV